MEKTVYLLSHIPNPRILKRVKSIEDNFQIDIIFWDRGIVIKEDFSISEQHGIHKILIEAPLGKPIKRIKPFFKFRRRALKKLFLLQPDIIHAANLDMLSIAISYKKNVDVNVRIIYEVADLPKYAFEHSNPFIEIFYNSIRKYERRLTYNISKLILTSPYFWNSYYSGFIDSKKYVFIPNAPFKKTFQNYKLRNELDSFVVGFIGSVRYNDELKVLIDVVEELNETFRLNISIFIAGSGPGLTDIKKYADNKNFVNFYGPYNYENDISSLYEEINLTYSVYDNRNQNVRIALPNRLYESVVAERPILASSETYLSSIVQEKNIGYSIVDKKDLKDKLKLLVEDENIYFDLVKNCKKIKKDFYFDSFIENIISMYRE